MDAASFPLSEKTSLIKGVFAGKTGSSAPKQPEVEHSAPRSKWAVNISPLSLFKSVWLMLFGEPGERPFTNVFLVLLPLGECTTPAAALLHPTK